MKQQTFSDIEYSNRRRKTRRDHFLDTMDAIIPWDEWIGMIRPYYYKNTRGRRAKDLEVMLRMYLMQDWFGLSNKGVEEAIYDSYSMRNFLGINFVEEQVPAETTLRRFRRLLDTHGIKDRIAEDLRARLKEAGLIMHSGNVVEAALTAAPGRADKTRQ